MVFFSQGTDFRLSAPFHVYGASVCSASVCSLKSTNARAIDIPVPRFWAVVRFCKDALGSRRSCVLRFAKKHKRSRYRYTRAAFLGCRAFLQDALGSRRGCVLRFACPKPPQDTRTRARLYGHAHKGAALWTRAQGRGFMDARARARLYGRLQRELHAPCKNPYHVVFWGSWRFSAFFTIILALKTRYLFRRLFVCQPQSFVKALLHQLRRFLGNRSVITTYLAQRAITPHRRLRRSSLALCPLVSTPGSALLLLTNKIAILLQNRARQSVRR